MNLPPLNALRAFEAAGRHASFLLAAQELHVSAASISRFVKLLEADLQQTLFLRHSNGVELTEIGEHYLAAIQPHLNDLRAISNTFRNNKAKRNLTIISIPAIAETWLVSHLWSFQQQHKDIQISLVLDDQDIRIKPNDATVWLTPGEHERSLTPLVEHNTERFPLSQDELTLVCNSEIASNIHQPNDIFNYPLLVDVDWECDWRIWLEAANITQPDNHEIMYFDRYSMVINAALAGTGVAIGHTALLQSYLSNGTLLTPLGISAPPEKQFFAVVAKHTKKKSVQQFANWFMGREHFDV